MKLVDRLRSIPLFSELDDEHLEQLCAASEEVALGAGASLFEEGGSADRAYLITSGEIAIIKDVGARKVTLAVRVAGDVIGEMSLLEDSPRLASAVARTDAALVAIPRRTLDDLIDTSPTAARRLFSALVDRWQSIEEVMREQERLAQLGAVTAGLAHELNNPAAAIRSGATSLRTSIQAHASSRAQVDRLALDDERLARLESLEQRAHRTSPAPALGPLERSDREEQLAARLGSVGVEQPWDLASALVDVLESPSELETILEEFGADAGLVLEYLATTRSTHSLIRQIEVSAERMGAIVGALKSYTYLDRAPVQSVDVRTGLDDTLLVLHRALDGVIVTRDYADDLPVIEACGAELNQVWTNLIDNAAGAMASAGVADPHILVRAMADGDGVAVEVIDNGPGIPDDIRHRMFDPFFTTKPPGTGTGLGLDISRNIVHQHGGTITVDSRPGHTTFRVELPARPPG